MYINFFPGNTQNTRSIEVGADAAYGMACDLEDFLDSMLKGCTASIALDGVKDAICDGAYLATLTFADETAVQEIVEELHDAI